MENNLQKAQSDVTKLYQSLMESEAIRTDSDVWMVNSTEANCNGVLAGLPPKVKNEFRFTIVKVPSPYVVQENIEGEHRADQIISEINPEASMAII